MEQMRWNQAIFLVVLKTKSQDFWMVIIAPDYQGQRINGDYRGISI
jgi:hypothetical protein